MTRDSEFIMEALGVWPSSLYVVCVCVCVCVTAIIFTIKKNYFTAEYQGAVFLFFFKKIFFNVYLFLRQRESEREWGRGRERGRHRI